jgi:hypothetical protein
MKWALFVGGIVLLLVGGVWTLQGLGIVGGSFMTGSKFWLAVGLLLAVAGVAGIAGGLRRLLGRAAGDGVNR